MTESISIAIGEIAQVNPKIFKLDDDLLDKKVTFLPMASVSEQGKIVTDQECVMREVTKGYTYFEKGDILLAKITPCMENGKAAFVDTIKHQIGFGSTEFHVLRPSDQIDGKYLFYMVWNPIFRKIAERNMTGTAGQKRVPTDFIKRYKIPLPPIAEQKRIAAILDKADAIRRKRQEAIKLTEELGRSLFLDMFGDPVTNPKGWEVKTIEHITKNEKEAIKRGPFGGSLTKDMFIKKGYLVYEQYHALNNDFSFERYYIDENKFEEMKGFEVKPGDIIISCSGVYLGKLAIIPERAKKGIINQALLKITLDQTKMKNHFFTFHFSQKSFKNKFFGSNRGSGVPNFPPMNEFKTFPFIVPPIDKQNQFQTRLEKNQDYEKKAQESLKESENLFNSLLQRAFKGEL